MNQYYWYFKLFLHKLQRTWIFSRVPKKSCFQNNLWKGFCLRISLTALNSKVQPKCITNSKDNFSITLLPINNWSLSSIFFLILKSLLLCPLSRNNLLRGEIFVNKVGKISIECFWLERNLCTQSSCKFWFGNFFRSKASLLLAYSLRQNIILNNF